MIYGYHHHRNLIFVNKKKGFQIQYSILNLFIYLYFFIYLKKIDKNIKIHSFLEKKYRDFIKTKKEEEKTQGMPKIQ